MQNVMVFHDPLSSDPSSYVTYPECNLWTNDNQISWKLLDPLFEWVTITFNADWVLAGGSQPQADPNDPSIYTTTGPAPNTTGAPIAYVYTMAIRPKSGGNEVRVARKTSGGVYIDPDVWNQPQP